MSRVKGFFEGRTRTWIANVALGIVLVLMLGTFVGTVWIISSDNAQRRSDALANCRSLYANRVNQQMGEVQAGKARVDIIDSRLDVVFFQTLVAVVSDEEEAAELLIAYAQILAAQVEPLSVMVEDAVIEYQTRVTEQRSAARLARSDPAAFLRICSERFGDAGE